MGKRVSYEYNELNQEIKQIINDEIVRESEYDNVGNVKRIKTTSKGVVVFEGEYEYNVNNSLIKESIKQNGKDLINT